MYNSLLSDRPSPPQNLRVVEVYKDYVIVAWDVPASDGGSEITAYIVEKRDAKREAFVNAGTVEPDTLQFKVPKLVESNKYFFRVYAENEVGRSDPASIDDPVTAKLPFGMLHTIFYERT